MRVWFPKLKYKKTGRVNPNDGEAQIGEFWGSQLFRPGKLYSIEPSYIVEREQGTMFGRVLRKKWKGRNFITKL